MAHRGDSLGKDVCCIDDRKRRGSQRLTPTVRDYYNEGAMDLITLRDNKAAFDRYKIRPRILFNVEDISTETNILDTDVSLPFGVSPAASHKLAHPDGELATSRAAAKFGICMGLSSYSTYSLEDVILEGQAAGTGGKYVPSKAFLDALQTNFQTPRDEESIRHSDEPSPRLDNFHPLETSPSDRDLSINEQKDQETILQDIHLQDSHDYPETLYKQIYSIPETWLSLLSQTTRLVNVMENFRHAQQSVDNLSFGAYDALHRRSVRLEYMICSLASRYVDTDISDSTAQPNLAHHIFRALSAALLIFFYRRIHDVHPLLLQQHIDTVISGLDAFRLSSRTAEGQDQPIVLGSIWPAFIAGCEAIDSKRRDAAVSWFDRAYASSELKPIATARDIMARLWERQDRYLINRGERVESWIELVREEGVWPILC